MAHQWSPCLDSPSRGIALPLQDPGLLPRHPVNKQISSHYEDNKLIPIEDKII